MSLYDQFAGLLPSSRATPPVHPPVPVAHPAGNILNGFLGSGGGVSGASAPSNPYGGVANDPAYLQAQADAKAALDAARAGESSSINQALIQFGMVPDLAGIGKSLGLTPDQLKAIGDAILPNTGALANQFTQSGDSVLGRLNQAHDQALSSLRASLAAHGTLQSGATGVGTGLENTHYQQGLSDADTNLMNQLLGYHQNYLNAESQSKSALESSANDAYNRAVQMAQQFPGLYSTVPAASGAAANAGAAHVAPLAPFAKTGTPNRTGLSANARQGVFSIH